jgi:hypothetical protein
MPDTVKTGTILIKEGTLLPESLRFESKPCAPGWRLVKNLNGYELGRKIHEAGWTFFGLTGEIGATVFGFDEQKTLRRAVEQILANLESAKFNSLEIMRVTSEVLKTFPGSALCYCLRPVKAYPGKRVSSWGQGPSGRGPRAIGCRLNQSIGLASRSVWSRTRTSLLFESLEWIKRRLKK